MNSNPDLNATLKLAGMFESEDVQRPARREPGWGETDYLGWLDRTQLAELLNDVRVGDRRTPPHPELR